MKPIGPRTYLAYGNFRFLKVSVVWLLISVLVYWWHDPEGGPSGGSWLGYTYGTIAALMILWLMWFGIRKRSYVSVAAPLQAWLSAHVYLGLALLLIVPLHSGFQFGWNLHTLAYALMSAVIVSGIVGVQFYAFVPSHMTRNRPGQKLEALMQQVADIDADCRVQADPLPNWIAKLVSNSIERTHVGGGLLKQLSAREPRCPTREAIDVIQRHVQQEPPPRGQEPQIKRILALLGTKASLLARIRRDLRFKALLDIWLVFHVPLAFATVAAVAAHVIVVFYYW